MGITRLNSHARKTRFLPALLGPLFALILIASCVVFVSPFSAQALTVEKTTVRPNDPDTSMVISDVPTRVTWQARVEEGDDIVGLELMLPEKAYADEANLSSNLVGLDGLNRLELDVAESSVRANHESGGQEGSIVVNYEFVAPIPDNILIRVEIEGVSLPPSDGTDPLITGVFKAADGQVIEIEPSGGVEVVQVGLTTKIISWLDEQAWVEAWNSNMFLSMFFKPQLIVASIPSLFFGWLRALALVAVGFPLAIPLGLALAFLKMSNLKILRFIASLFINVVRGTPLFLQVYIAFFGLPLLGIVIDNYILGVLVLAMNSSAYLAEIFRAGIQSIHKGQFEAAASLGLNKVQTMVSVILPQTVRRVIPTMTSEFILLYKDTSLLSSVGVLELMMFSRNLTATSGNITPYIVAAGYYLIVTLPLIKAVNVLEKRLAEQESGKAADEKAEPSALSSTAHESM